MGARIVYRPAEFASRLRGGIPDTMRDVALYLQSSANRKIASGIGPANAPLTQAVKRGDRTLRDNNTMASSIAPHFWPLRADASTNARQARILQEGGVIKSKGKGLWIPAGYRTRQLIREFNASGPADLITKMKAAGYETFFTPLSKVFCAQKGKRGKPFALYLVKGSVTIPARPFLYHDEADRAYILKLVQRGVREKMEK